MGPACRYTVGGSGLDHDRLYLQPATFTGAAWVHSTLEVPALTAQYSAWNLIAASSWQGVAYRKMTWALYPGRSGVGLNPPGGPDPNTESLEVLSQVPPD